MPSLDPTDPGTEFAIEHSDTPPMVDGLADGEPKWLVCEYCGARVRLTRHADDPGAWRLPHRRLPDGSPCPNAADTR